MTTRLQPSSSRVLHNSRRSSQLPHGIQRLRRTIESNPNNRSSFIDRSQYVSRSDRFSFNIVVPEELDEDSTDGADNDPLLGVLNKTWKVFRASPLFNFKYNTSDLKQYARLLRNYLRSQNIARSKDVQYQTKFSVLDGLKWMGNHQDAIQVEVLSITDGRKPVILYLGILLSYAKLPRNTSNSFVHLPLLLCIGAVRTLTSVHSVLSKLFDSFINPIEINQYDLMWINMISLSNTKRELTEKSRAKRKEVHLHYRCSQVPGGKVSITLPFDKIQMLWEKIRAPPMEQILKEQVVQFHSIIEDQLRTLHGLQFSHLQLCQFDFPSLCMTIEGRIKIRNLDTVKHVLNFLTSATTILEHPNPGLSVSLSL